MWLRSRSSFAVHHAGHEHNQSLGLNELHEHHCKCECAFNYKFELFFSPIWNSDINARNAASNADDYSDSRL